LYTGVYVEAVVILDRSVVVEAGTRLVRREGVEMLGLRRVAAELGVTPMALYRHVDNADTLQVAVVEQLLAGFPDVPTTGPWQERCHTWAHDARAALMPYPGLARHVLLHWVELPGVLRSLDHLGAALATLGPAGIDAVAASNALFTYVLMRVQAEEVVRFGGLERDLATLGDLAVDVPFLWSHRHEYAVARLDEHFEYGLDALLSGIVTAHRRSRRAHP
jgi:AcrR family transcriptional regulator